MWVLISDIFLVSIHLQFSNKYPSLVKQPERALIQWIIHVVDDLADSGVDDHLRALEARGERGVDDGILERHAVIGSLDDGIFLSVRAQALFQIGSRRGQAVA